MYYDEKGGRHPVINKKGIFGFFDEYRFLSNFQVCPVEYKGIVYGSSEAAYMSCKTDDPELKELFALASPSEARKAGQMVELFV